MYLYMYICTCSVQDSRQVAVPQDWGKPGLSASLRPGHLGQSLEVKSPGVGDIERLGLAASAWSGVEDIHTLAAGTHYLGHKTGAITADILQDTAMSIDMRELLLHTPPLWPLQGSEEG
jgi:hypothetical protein